MNRTSADRLNLVSRTRSVVEQRFPDEEVLFATAVTILETPHASPTGWSWRRIFQRRGNVVITNGRVFVQSSARSLLTFIWLAVFGYSLIRFWKTGNIPSVVLAFVAAIFILQRRPYSRDIPFDRILRVEFGSVQGVSAWCDLLSIVIDGRAVQLVAAQVVPDSVRERLQRLGEADSVT